MFVPLLSSNSNGTCHYLSETQCLLDSIELTLLLLLCILAINNIYAMQLFTRPNYTQSFVNVRNCLSNISSVGRKITSNANINTIERNKKEDKIRMVLRYSICLIGGEFVEMNPIDVAFSRKDEANQYDFRLEKGILKLLPSWGYQLKAVSHRTVACVIDCFFRIYWFKEHSIDVIHALLICFDNFNRLKQKKNSVIWFRSDF